ncbi:MAG: MaoC family dehydratase [Rectinemataceae bacterium]|nr:MaoC family dehydratase [Rectinemataceae bacterium]
MDWKTGDTAGFRRTLTQEDFNRFAALSHDDNPIHVDPAFAAKSHFGATVSHGMMLYSLISKGLSELIPGPGSIQLEQELMFPNGTYTGEEILVSLSVTGVGSDGSLEISTVISRAEDATNIKTQGRARVAPRGMKPSSAAGSGAARSAPAEQGGEAFYGLEVGMFTEKKRTFTAADLAEYGNLSGDRNPVLRDADYAREHGFAGPLVPWPLLGGMFSDMLGTHLPGRGTGWMKQKLSYPNCAYPGEELTARVEITRLRKEKELVNLRSTIRAADGRLVCDGESLVLVRNLENKDDKGSGFGRG